MLVFASLSAWAQPQKGDFEIGLSGTGGSLKHEITSDYESFNDSNTLNYLMLFTRPAYYVVPQFSIEPEIIWAIADQEETSLEVSVNVAYNIFLKNPQFVPFIFAGYGRGNSMILNNMALYKSTDGLDVSVFNVGAGLKTFVGEHVSLRVEYRYQNRQAESKGGVYDHGVIHFEPITEKYLSSIIMFGFSYFF
jgi:opacity protein-like surface antigen